MNTHELAGALTVLARVLRTSPKIEIDNLHDIFEGRLRELDSKQIEVGLSHLVALSSVNKKKWIELIHEYNFPISIRPRDSSRDLLSRLLKYLERTPEARERIMKTTYQTGIKVSPPLLKALDSLLKE